MHMNVVVVVCDYFCKTVWIPMGKRTAYALTFIHLGCREVFLFPITYYPTDKWMRQQARNVSIWAEEEGIDVRFLIHDRDAKFYKNFDDSSRREEGGVVQTLFGSLIANAFAESWIGTMKLECLNHLFCLSPRHLDYIVQA